MRESFFVTGSQNVAQLVSNPAKNKWDIFRALELGWPVLLKAQLFKAAIKAHPFYVLQRVR